MNEKLHFENKTHFFNMSLTKKKKKRLLKTFSDVIYIFFPHLSSIFFSGIALNTKKIVMINISDTDKKVVFF